MFFCKECGNEFKKWYGKCPKCKEYNTIMEMKEPNLFNNKSNNKSSFLDQEIKLEKINEVSIKKELRISTKIKELDKVLGGGIVPASITLIGGTPGVGKSTLTLQICQNLINNGKLLYISGEETVSQIKLRSQRLKQKLNDNFLIANTKNLEQIFASVLKNEVKYLIIDSIQTMQVATNPNISGSISQLKETTLKLMYFAKEYGITVFLIGHVTKEGDLAGPKLLEHMVDTVIYLEGEKETNYKILRSTKNRFGNTGEIGLFQMTQTGLISLEKIDGLYNLEKEDIGTAIGIAQEGERFLFLEVQSLGIPVEFGYPKRVAQGYDLQRFNLLIGLIQKRLNINFLNYDCYLNISTLLKNKTYALDLAVVASLISTKKNQKLKSNEIYLGEVSLTGEVKKVQNQLEKIKESQRLGFKKIYCNAQGLDVKQINGIEIINITNIQNFL